MRCFQFAVFPLLIMMVSGNSPPIFEGPLFETLSEDLPVEHTAFWLLAMDPDGDQLSYAMHGPFAYFFKVNATSGEVKISVQLDYEKQPLFLVMITVGDTSNQVITRTITIVVENCNDNAPIFHNTPYAEKIKENQPQGSVIFNVSASDADDGIVPVTYNIDEVTPNNVENHYLFYIQQNGSVILNGTLDYNSKSIFYQMKIRATDREGKLNNTLITHNTTTFLSIDVVDVPDRDPQFLGTPYVASVLENSKQGTVVLKVEAIDGDQGIHDEITYSIKNATVPALFGINGTTGEVFVIGLIDREQLLDLNEQVLLEVVAQEKDLNIASQTAQAVTQVTIRVTDVNDNTPEFYFCELPSCDFTGPPQNSFVGFIDEHSSTRVPVEDLNITVHDPDKDSNGTFTLSLEGPDAAAFSVSPSKVVNTATVQILVRDPSKVDQELVKVMRVVIVAQDSGRNLECCSRANMTIHIHDINDHSPVFADTVYKLSVKENSKNGTSVGTITATDPDTGIFGQITYWLLPESIRDTFQVNGSSGEITVRNGNLLDREIRTVYYATLQALDGMNLTGTTLLEISVQDENDNDPVVTGSYNAFMNENTGSISIQIQAYDNDEPGTNNSQLQFQILDSPFSENFTISPDSGLLTNTGPLDREAIDAALSGKIVLTVRVYDLGVPQRQALVNVTITVEDLNDNPPVFSLSSYTFNVTEREMGADVGNVEVTDADQTEINNRVTFRIISGNSGTFLIRSYPASPGRYWGNLTVDPDISLNYETQKSFTLVVEAQDAGINNIIFTASTMVYISVLDVNDEPPIVVPSSLEDKSVSENGHHHGLVTTLRGFDKDTQHLLVFEELAVACYKGRGSADSICQGWLHLYANGSLFVNDSGAVDFESCDRVVLTLRVEDVLTQLGDRYSDNVTLTINILDVNDNAPVFLQNEEAFVVVPDVAPIEYQVAVVQATDNDTGPYGAISFSIKAVEFISSSGSSMQLSAVFKVVTTSQSGIYTGSIRVASSLDGSLKGQYRVEVIAGDGGGLNSTKFLDIYAVDQSFLVKLEFSEPADKVQGVADRIKRNLVQATKATVYIARIRDASMASRSARAQVKSVMDAYFVYNNGTALTPDEVIKLINGDISALSELMSLGLAIIGGSNTVVQDDKKKFIGIIAGLAAGLVLLVAIMITALVCTRKSYQRKLKAMKAMKVAKTLPSNAVQGGPGIPGTNKYNMEGANPVLNLNIDSAMDLGFDEHNSAMDSVSLNSLDEHLGDMLDEDVKGFRSREAYGYVPPDEPLSAALKDHNPKTSQGTKKTAMKLDDTPFVFNNEALDTTDL